MLDHYYPRSYHAHDSEQCAVKAAQRQQQQQRKKNGSSYYQLKSKANQGDTSGKSQILSEDKENNRGEFYDNFIQKQRHAKQLHRKHSSEARVLAAKKEGDGNTPKVSVGSGDKGSSSCSNGGDGAKAVL